MKAILIDDEIPALRYLERRILEAEPSAELTLCNNPKEGLLLSKDGDFDVAFLDIHMQGIDGMNLAKQMQEYHPTLNVIFTTGYPEHALDAFKLNASGYLVKPVRTEEVREQLASLRYPIKRSKRVRFQCFGNFEAFIDEKPMTFHYTKTREMLAFLVSRNGTLCSSGQIMTALWGDSAPDAYLRKLRKDLLDALKANGLEEIVFQQRGSMGILADKVECDYYDMLETDKPGKYQGEFMAQYSWAEDLNALLQDKFGMF